MKKRKLLQLGKFVILVIIFSGIGIIISDNFGFALGIGFTMVALPVALRLIRVKNWVSKS